MIQDAGFPYLSSLSASIPPLEGHAKRIQEKQCETTKSIGRLPYGLIHTQSHYTFLTISVGKPTLDKLHCCTSGYSVGKPKLDFNCHCNLVS